MPRNNAFSILVFVGAFAGCLSDGSGSVANKDINEAQIRTGSPAVYPGQYRFDGPYSQVLSEGPYKALPPVHQFIKSKVDGVDIEVGYHLPDVPEGTRIPLIVHASPYHRPAGSVIQLRGQMLFLHDNFLPHGYAIAAVAVRGTANSGGCMDLMGKKEASDLDTAITWLAAQPWSNGNVAMTGGSYDGSTPWEVAAVGNPHLKTIVPISGIPDLYGLGFRNGSGKARSPLGVPLFYSYGWHPEDANRTPDKRIQGLVCPESWEGLTAMLHSSVTGEHDLGGWWAERNHKPAVERRFRGSVLLVQGLQDWNVDPHVVIPWIDALHRKGVYTKQLLGQWGHAYPDGPTYITHPNGTRTVNPLVRFDWAEIQLRWYDYWLKDIRTTDLGPAVQVQDQLLRWRNEESYPPHDASWTTYHLASGQKLAPQPGSPGSVLLFPNPIGEAMPAASVRSLPGYQADFTTAPVENPTAFAGLPRLHITVTPHGPTGHLAAHLYDVDPEGRETRIGWTQMNLWFADGTETRKTLTPNQPILAKMEFQPLDAHLEPGHSLRLRVWEYQYSERLPSVPPEPVTLNYGGTVKSVLEVPIVERGSEAYFQPPVPPNK